MITTNNMISYFGFNFIRKSTFNQSMQLEGTYLGLLRSRWMILWSCKYLTPEAICLVHSTNLIGGTLSFPFRKKLKRGPYGQYSMTIQNTGAWVQTPLNCMMLWWLSFFKWCMFVSDNSLTFLTATNSVLNFPTNTAPWAPDPSHWRSEIDSNGISQSSSMVVGKKNY